ncbi:family 78 glycoside hydrolase catalytic domain [Pelagicoccus sp. SDUM812005]|uniref:family 78 glycoside hydrolase catalytic domain n=1 Tax=Pelagicoccus sp. SDUM812005 TaxID=3041257 RepID=UPI00280E0E52|nr:family 78 glycoside hydrolase catalytic domain [Pelagicoccus sp. SDUM812005]MDQ8179409.1 family 78 glycoside hydrolase catalytic domain [Pelagicoccus sp. SDUM812005]
MAADLDWLPDGFPEPNESQLCQRSYLTETMGAAVLSAAAKEFDTREKWDAYRDLVRRKILQGAGLDPLPRRTALQPMIHSRREYDGYSVENVAIETVPGFWATGNLFRPLNPQVKVPGILNTHGHAGRVERPEQWARYGRFHEQNQIRAAALAKMGAVVFSIDMFAYADGIPQVGVDAHGSEVAMRIQLWNAIRALDFLESLPEVDSTRLGVTGYSGGGTQAFLLSGVDDRVAATAPVAMVSSYFFGGCPCESGRPVHRSEEHFASNAMIAAMAAPKSQILISDGGDWTKNTPEVEYPFLQRIYSLYGAQEQVSNVHLPDEGHNYGPNKRKAMYPFFAEAFGLDLSAILNGGGEIEEAGIVVETPDRLRVFNEAHRVPVGALRSAEAVGRALDRLQPRSVDLSIYDLRTDDRVDPLGIDSVAPRLSWKLESRRRNVKQRAYRILVASDRASLEPGKADLWDSGKVFSNEQYGIGYEGEALDSGQQVYWSVKVWDDAGLATDWATAATWTSGALDGEAWGEAKWVTHPRWLEEKRDHLGYRSRSAESVDTPKWIEIDLGKAYAVDEVVLHALRHTVAERLGFPTEFKVALSEDAAFSEPYLVADYTLPPHTNKWFTQHRFELEEPQLARYFRMDVPKLRELDGEICLALSQIEIRSGGRNVALGAKVSASDSKEEGLWSASALVDGKGVPGSNTLGTKTIRLRREFEARGGVRRALMHLTGLGQYVLHINGRRVGQERLSPGWTDTDETVLYDTREVSAFLNSGPNAIGIELASGMYSVSHPEGRYTKFVGRFRPLKAIVSLSIEYEDGSMQELVTDENWRCSVGPTVYSHIYGGEDFDARLDEAGWSSLGFAGDSWEAVSFAAAPKGRLRGASHAAPPLSGHETLKPVAVVELKEGVSVYDFGQNASLMPEIQVKGEAGSAVRLIPGELLREDGSVYRGSSAHGGKDAYWQYTLGGQGKLEGWRPEFFYHGARYLQVERVGAVPGGSLPELVRIESVVTHSSSEQVGHFACSSDLFNRTRSLIRWAQRSNMVSVLTDCPHRERLGWMEQYHLNGPSLRYEFDVNSLFRKSFGDMVDSQTEAGLVPNVSPEFITFDGAFRDSPEWGSALILASWQQYLWTGDLSVFQEHYDSMRAYVSYLGSKAAGRLLSHGLGDWYDLGPGRPGFSQLTPISLSASAIYYEDVATLAKIVRLLGKEEETKSLEALASEIKVAFNQAHFDQEAGNYGASSQAGNAMAYVLGLVPEGYETSVMETIVSDIRARGNGFTAGDVGHRYLLLALSKAGRSDVIFDMHHQSDRPGYGMQLAKGATSLTEAWDADRHSSHNHFMLGHIMEWFYAGLAGIGPDEAQAGFRKVRVKPQPIEGIEWAEARFEGVRGPIELRWRKEGETFELALSVPANCEASVDLPLAGAGIVSVNGVALREAEGVEVGERKATRQTVSVGSGIWRFQAR